MSKEQETITGNAAAMREALSEIRCRLVYLYGKTDGTFDPPAIKEVYEIAEAALSAPPRNCDVGTAEEQQARFIEYCKIHEGCSECQIVKPWCRGVKSCGIIWNNMPYKEGGTK